MEKIAHTGVCPVKSLQNSEVDSGNHREANRDGADVSGPKPYEQRYHGAGDGRALDGAHRGLQKRADGRQGGGDKGEGHGDQVGDGAAAGDADKGEADAAPELAAGKQAHQRGGGVQRARSDELAVHRHAGDLPGPYPKQDRDDPCQDGRAGSLRIIGAGAGPVIHCPSLRLRCARILPMLRLCLVIEVVAWHGSTHG